MSWSHAYIPPLRTARERARVVRMLTIYHVTQLTVFILVIAFVGSGWSQVISVLGLIQGVVLLFLTRSKWLDVSRLMTPLALFVVLTAYMSLSGVRGLANIAFPTFIAATMVMLGKNAARIGTVAAILVVMVTWYLQYTQSWNPGSALPVGLHTGWLIALVYYGTYLLMAQFFDIQQEDVALVVERERELAETLAHVSEQNDALEASESRYRLLAENIDDVVWVYTTNLEYVYCSPSVYVQRGYTPEEVRDIPLVDQFVGDAMERLVLMLGEELARDGNPGVDPDRTKTIEYEIFCKDGSTVWLETVVSFLRDDAGAPVSVLGVSRDITERRAAMAERESYQAQIQHMQKMESLGLLAGGVAHDFNNILLGIMGNADLALRKLGDDDSARENVEQLVVSAGRAAELCNQLLAYSGKGRFETRLVDVSRLVEETAALLSLPVGQRIKMEYELAENLPYVNADPSQLRQIALNLIFNAREAIGDEPGSVRLVTGYIESISMSDPELKVVPDYGPGPFVYLSVTDDGCGMDEATRRRVFDPFFTTKQDGHGLGLSAVSGIAKRHGGGIALDSEEGAGTVITVYLPASLTPAAAPKSQSESGPVQESLSGTVLVVDDEEVVRTFARHALELFGVTVLTAENGQEATDLFQRKPEAIDAILMDMTMPVMGGIEALGAIREIRGDVPVVLSSGYDEESAAQRLVEEGHAKFIHKPYRVRDLAEVLKTVLA